MTTAKKSSDTLSADKRNKLDEGSFAFPKQRKEPLNNASHVRNAIARFDQVKDVTDQERDDAFRNIKAAAKKFNVEVTEASWHELGSSPKSLGKAAKKTSAKKTAKKAAKKAQKKSPEKKAKA